MAKNIMLYPEAMRMYEPFDGLECRAVKEEIDENDENTTVVWCKEKECEYYGLYAHSINDDRWMCIADFDSKLDLFVFAEMLNIASGYTLPLENLIGVI